MPADSILCAGTWVYFLFFLFPLYYSIIEVHVIRMYEWVKNCVLPHATSMEGYYSFAYGLRGTRHKTEAHKQNLLPALHSRARIPSAVCVCARACVCVCVSSGCAGVQTQLCASMRMESCVLGMLYNKAHQISTSKN